MKYFASILILLSSLACNNTFQKTNNQVEEPEAETVSNRSGNYVPQSVNPQTAANLKNFLIHDFIKDELEFIPEEQRKFQFYKIDLNGDGNEEIFVRLLSSYFCGSGGCTFLLLDKYGEIITRFTVTRAPFWVEPTKENGWSVILLKDAGVFKEVVYDNGKYPGNPSLLPKAPYDAPSGHAQLVFDEDFAPCKTYAF